MLVQAVAVALSGYVIAAVPFANCCCFRLLLLLLLLLLCGLVASFPVIAIHCRFAVIN